MLPVVRRGNDPLRSPLVRNRTEKSVLHSRIQRSPGCVAGIPCVVAGHVSKEDWALRGKMGDGRRFGRQRRQMNKGR